MVKRKRSREDSSPSSSSSTNYASLGTSELPTTIMRCSLPPHEPLDFGTYADYEVHYKQTHSNRCLECGNNFPTDHYLNLHIAENHDPLNEARRERGDKIYACFVEDCDRMCSTWRKRRMHLVDKHGFPRNYDFLIINNGLDQRNSMLRSDAKHRRRSSVANTALQRGRGGHARSVTATESEVREVTQLDEAGESSDTPMNDAQIDAAGDDMEPNSQSSDSITAEPNTSKSAAPSVDSITNSMSALRFVPPSITFGRPKAGAGFAKE
ncbi:hypothetical protein LTR66_002905 [Elasticomyces elasticus]|nr:hypothetical protein LTR66_002905 [Elasticomyces elasticus]